MTPVMTQIRHTRVSRADRHGVLAGPRPRAVLLLFGFAAAIMVRELIGGVQAATSPVAGLTFAAALVGLAWASGVRTPVTLRAVALGCAGALILCVPVVAAHAQPLGAHRPAGSYATWALVVGVVAMAEEAFLRGALYDDLARGWGSGVAIVVGAVAFAALHVPLYGWHAGALDLAVGLLLGVLRNVSGSWVAPGLAHTVADLAGWWLR